MNVLLFKNRVIRICILSTIILHIFGDIAAQSTCTRQTIVESVKKNLYKFYIDEDLAKVMIDTLNNKFYRKGYDAELNIDEFLFEVTRDLRCASGDLHIMFNSNNLGVNSRSVPDSNVRLSDKQLKKLVKKNKDELDKINRLMRKQSTMDAFSYGEISILNNSIGYVEIKNLNSVNRVNKNYQPIPVTSVFQKFKNTRAIIIDLRECLGGTTLMAAKLSSFFSTEKNTYFATGENILRYDSGGGFKTIVHKRAYTTALEINNSTTKDKKVYILISKRTFSAAELAVYKIKRFLPQALIIGERTFGSANGYFGLGYDSCFSFIIPSERIYDETYSNYNFEGIGITPDIEINADSSLNTVYRLLELNFMDVDRKYFKKSKKIAGNNTLTKSRHNEFVGDYRKAVIIADKGKLEMIYDEFLKETLVPVAENEFQTATFSSIKFFRNGAGAVTEIWIKENVGFEYIEKFRKL